MKDVEAARVFHQLQDRIDLDIQFYLICWDKIHKYSRVIAKNTTNKEIEKIAEDVANFTEKGTLARHYHEHLDTVVHESREGFPRSKMFSGGVLFFKYVDVSRKQEKTERANHIAKRYDQGNEGLRGHSEFSWS